MSEEAQSSNNPRKIKDQRARDKNKADTDDDALRWMLADERGRRFIRRLLMDCHEHNTSFHTNAAVMGFSEGERSVALKLKARILGLDPKPSEAVLIAVLLSGE